MNALTPKDIGNIIEDTRVILEIAMGMRRDQVFSPGVMLGQVAGHVTKLVHEIRRLNDRADELLVANNREVERRREAEVLANWYYNNFQVELEIDTTLPIGGAVVVDIMAQQVEELKAYEAKWGSINEVKS